MQNWNLVSFEPTRRLRFSVFVLPLLSALACEVRAEIDEREIRKAIERGRCLREATPIPVAALGPRAWILNIAGVRCGHAAVAVTEADKNTRGSYVLRGESKTATVLRDGDLLSVISYEFLLDADLTLVSGTIQKSQSKQNPIAFEAYTRIASLKIENGQLHWKRTELRQDGAPAAAEISRHCDLHGLRPMPEQGLFLLGPLAAAQDKLRVRHDTPCCIPTLTTDQDFELPDIEPAWLEFGDSVFGRTHPNRINMILRYYFSGRIAEDGWHVRDPEPVAAWPSEWVLETNGALLRLPKLLALERWEPIAPEKLDPNSKLDFEQIKAAWTNLNATMKQAEEEYKDRPQKLNELMCELFGE
jgi:hypothetical protein